MRVFTYETNRLFKHHQAVNIVEDLFIHELQHFEGPATGQLIFEFGFIELQKHCLLTKFQRETGIFFNCEGL